MLRLIHFEFKKIFADSATKYIFILLAFFTFFSIYNDISEYFVFSSKKDINLWHEPYNGLQAIKIIKKRFYNYECDITAELLRQVGKDSIKLEEEFHNKVENNDWSYARLNAEKERNSMKLFELYPQDIVAFYYVINRGGISDMNRLNEAIPNDFYKQWFKYKAYRKVSSSSSSFEQDTKKTKDLRYKYLTKLSIPYRYRYCEGWGLLSYRTQHFQKYLPAIILLVFIILLKYEQESGMQAFIFTTKYGRTKAVYSKIISAILIATVLYTIAFLIYSLSILTIFGFKGWNVQIQVSSLNEAIHNLNFLEFLLLQFLLALFLSVFTLLLSFFIFSISQNYIISLVATLVTLYGLPYLLNQIFVLNISSYAKYTSLIGVNILRVRENFLGSVPNGEFIYFFGIPILHVYGILIIYGLLSIVLMFLIAFNYKYLQIKK